jgi:transposase
MGKQMAKASKYTDEFKRAAVGLLENRGSRTVEQVADDVGVTKGQLYTWRSQLSGSSKKKGFSRNERSASDLEAEVLRLKKELDRVSKERELLKKSIAFFVKENG